MNDTKWYETLTVKLILLGGLAIMLMIPLQLVKEVISERESYGNEVKQEISEQWGRMQTITGPVLNVPVYRSSRAADGKTYTERSVWHLLPEQLEINCKVNPEIRYRGIYEAVIYDSDIHLEGDFVVPPGRDDEYVIQWDESYFTIGISDNRGIRDTPILDVGGQKVGAEPGVTDRQLFSSGISFPSKFINPGEVVSFSIDLGLRGSEGIYFSPAGKTTKVYLRSEWESPSFGGSFLPVKREIDGSGFSSEWIVTHLNRNFPQEVTGSFEGIDSDSFGVNLLLEVDHYKKAERSAKYGILFIALTFMVLLFMELTSERKIHIFNYFLVSLALVLFFSLLNSLSEHIGFNPAYIISSAATIILVTMFSGSLLEGKRAIIAISSLLTILYSFIFILLALKEFSYLAGNIGLFIALAVIMRLSSRTSLFNKSSV